MKYINLFKNNLSKNKITRIKVDHESTTVIF